MTPEKLFGFSVTIESGRVIHRSSQRRCSIEKDVLENFAKFTGKHLCQNLKVAGLRPAALLKFKKRLWHRCFPVNFAEFLRTTFYRTPSVDCFWIKIYSSTL